MPDDRDDAATMDEEVRARAFWSGTISFGLVSIPVNLFPANRSTHVALRMLSPDGTPLARRYFCSKEEKELDSDEIVRGFELDGRYIVVTDEELEGLAPRQSRDIDLRRFVPKDRIDPMYFERAYFLTPAGGSTKAYRLLAETMERTGQAGIATFVMRGKEYLVAILAENGVLRAETMRFHDELRTPADLELPTNGRPPSKEVTRIAKAIRARTEDGLDPAEMRDASTERLLELAARKASEQEDVVHAPADAEEEAGVIDLMEVIKRSMRAGRASETAGAKRSRAKAANRPRRGASKPGAAGADALDDLSKKELYERARELDIDGRSGMTKEQLARAIRRSA